MATQSKKKINAWWYAMPGVGPVLASANKSKIKATPKKANLTEKDKEDARKENELTKVLTSSGKYKEVDNKGKKVLQRVNGSESKKNGKKNGEDRPKLGGGAKRIQKRLRKAGFKQEELDKLGDKHRAWKAARKAGTLGDWEEKYHPGRGRYKNKKKKSKSNKDENKSTLKKNTTTNKVSKQQASKLLEQQKETARIMANDPRYKGPSYKKLKSSASRFK